MPSALKGRATHRVRLFIDHWSIVVRLQTNQKIKLLDNVKSTPLVECFFWGKANSLYDKCPYYFFFMPPFCHPTFKVPS